MLLINSKNEFPRYAGDLLLEYPDYVIGKELPTGWHLVAESEYPIAKEGEVVEELFPTLTNAGYVRTYKVRPFTEEELEIANAPKTARTKLIALGLTEIEIDALTRGTR